MQYYWQVCVITKDKVTLAADVALSSLYATAYTNLYKTLLQAKIQQRMHA
jgi:hypothetical protein